MKTVSMGRLVIAESKDGGENWDLLKPEDVPEWLKNQDVLGAMLEGCVSQQHEGEEGPMYCAVRVPDKIDAANDETPEGVSPILLGAPRLVPAPQPDVVGTMVEQGGIPLDAA